MRRGHPPSQAEALPHMEPQELPSASLLRAPAYPRDADVKPQQQNKK